MKYTQRSFTVPASGKREGECKHAWVKKERCVLCGEKIVLPHPILPEPRTYCDEGE